MNAKHRAALSLITTVGLLGACSFERLVAMHAEESERAFWIAAELVDCGVLELTGAGTLVVAEAA